MLQWLIVAISWNMKSTKNQATLEAKLLDLVALVRYFLHATSLTFSRSQSFLLLTIWTNLLQEIKLNFKEELKKSQKNAQKLIGLRCKNQELELSINLRDLHEVAHDSDWELVKNHRKPVMDTTLDPQKCHRSFINRVKSLSSCFESSSVKLNWVNKLHYIRASLQWGGSFLWIFNLPSI